MNYSSNVAGWRLVHDGEQAITFSFFNFGSVTQSINQIEEFQTEQEGQARITELQLNTDLIKVEEVQE